MRVFVCSFGLAAIALVACASGTPVGPWTLVRNGVLAALAAVLVIHGRGPAIDDWVAARSS